MMSDKTIILLFPSVHLSYIVNFYSKICLCSFAEEQSTISELLTSWQKKTVTLLILIPFHLQYTYIKKLPKARKMGQKYLKIA